MHPTTIEQQSDAVASSIAVVRSRVSTRAHCQRRRRRAMAASAANRGGRLPERAPERASYSPLCALEARFVTATENFEGCSRTTGLSISEMREISLIHWSGSSTAAILRAAFEFAP